jgi:uncharacterized protein YkwD
LTKRKEKEDQMMIARMLLCASALALGAPQATEPKPQPKAEQTATEKSAPKADKAAQTDAKTPAEAPDKVVDGVKLAAIEANIVSYTNQERVRFGLPALTVDKELMETAREHAAWMTGNQSLVHTNRPVAENIAMGQPHSSDVVQDWMNSSGHRANILNPGHGRIGVAAYRTANGTIFWCQQFRR